MVMGAFKQHDKPLDEFEKSSQGAVLRQTKLIIRMKEMLIRMKETVDPNKLPSDLENILNEASLYSLRAYLKKG
jgi:hypothetical protein